MSTHAPLRLVLLGAAADTTNLGVSALHHSVVGSTLFHRPDAEIVATDNGFGTRPGAAQVDGNFIPYHHTGVRWSRRYWRPETMQTTIALRRIGIRTPFARFVERADAVMDITGGDSFADLYGADLMMQNLSPRIFAIAQGLPLVLLPQTYGPFRSNETRTLAEQHVRRAVQAWARDVDSFENLKELAGSAFDPERHRLGVDVAFALVPRPDATPPSPLRDWLEPDRDRPLVGLNVNGDVWVDQKRGNTFGLTIDYRSTLERLLRRMLDESDARIMLVPHVIGHGHNASDGDASRALIDAVRAPADRVQVAPDPVGAAEAKWLIAQCDWFMGTRMHATIAALSTKVPCATIAYSLKARGVFDSVGQSSHVADARLVDDEQALDIIWKSYVNRAEAAASLAEAVPPVVERSRAQIGEILNAVVSTRSFG